MADNNGTPVDTGIADQRDEAALAIADLGSGRHTNQVPPTPTNDNAAEATDADETEAELMMSQRWAECATPPLLKRQ